MSALSFRVSTLTTPTKEAMIGLGLDTPDLHLFGQAMGRGGNEGISLAEEPARSRGLAAAPAAVKVAQAVPRQRFIVARRSAGSEISLCLLCSQVWRCRLHAPWEFIVLRPCHATDLRRPQVLLPAFPQVGVLGLGPIIIREDVAQGGTFGVLPPECRFAVCHGPGSQVPPGLLPAF